MSRVRPALKAARAWLLSAAGAVAIVALAHGLVWSLLTPPLQVPDETAHFAYVQHLAETGNLPPEPGHPEFSSEQFQAMDALHTGSIIGRPSERAPRVGDEQRTADRGLDAAQDASRSDGGGPSTASLQPPLYYAAASVFYRAAESGNFSTRVWAVRLLGVLAFVLTALAAAAFVAELIPGRAWAFLVGGLVVALQPSVAFEAAGATPDSFLFLFGTLTLLLCARILRRGLTARTAMLLGLVVACGAMSKITFLALLPGAAVALLFGLLALHRRGATPRAVAGLAARAIGAFAVLPVLYVLWVSASGRGLTPAGTSTPSLPMPLADGSLTGRLSYAWQLYLPRPGFLTDQFGFWPPYETWFKGFLGHFGWLDYQVGQSLIDELTVIACVGIALFLVGVVRMHRRLARRWPELVVYGVLFLGLAAVIAKAGYDYHSATGYVFEQARYLYPLIGLYAAGVATACMAFGRRWAPALVAGMIGIASLHMVLAMLDTAQRYYG